jgi:hypothetical protein
MLQSENCSLEECREIAATADANAKAAFELGKNVSAEFAKAEFLVAVEQATKALIYLHAAKVHWTTLSTQDYLFEVVGRSSIIKI